ncbi:MAG: AIR synthase-related protein [Endomicrobia bacterium]|nr:AIR synthase-related protein [Endomicrobiia bacterium]
MSAQSYLSRGVSPTKDDVHAAIKKQDKGLYPGAFCKIIEDVAGDKNYCSIIHADGAGTKVIIAYLYYKETGDASVFKGIPQDSLIMNIDDMICAGAVDNFVVSNTIGRNANRIDREILKVLIEGYASVIDELKKYGVNIIMAGGETADIGDIVSTVVVDSTVFSRLKRADVMDCDNIKPGDAIVGLASYGRAVYETEYNSGIASNGLTAARHILLSSEYKKFKETYSSTIEDDKVFSGKYMLSDKLPNSEQTVAQALLSPTRTYLPVVKEILEKEKKSVRAFIHCTGGGLVKSRNFGKNVTYVKNDIFDVPPIFNAIQAAGNIPMQEMFQIFNMGHRMEVYCEKEKAENIINISQRFGVDAKVIGRVEKNEEGKNKVIVKYKDETFVY